jgi:Ca2+-binding RTX toxin-like protein
MAKVLAHSYAELFTGSPGDEVSYEAATGGSMVVDPLGRLGGSTGWAAGDAYVGIDHFRLSDNGDTFVSFDTDVWVTGGAGIDVFYAGAGNDHFDGGGVPASSPLYPQGNVLSYAYATSGVTISIDSSGPKDGGAVGDTWVNIQSLEGSTHDDTLYSVDDGFDHLLLGDPSAGYHLGSTTGADKLIGAKASTHVKADGSAYFDTFIPEGGADTIVLGARGNWIDYENDPHTGGIVIDLLNSSLNTGDATGDTYLTITEQAITATQNNTVEVSLTGSNWDDSLYGTDGANKILGDPLAGVNYSADGDDTVHGRGGNDWLEGVGGADILYGDAGDDTLLGGDGADQLYGGDGNDVLNGGDGIGGISADILDGGNGDDVLTGGLGADVLYGGAGADTFVYTNLVESMGFGYDIIHDFTSGGDHLDLSAMTMAVTSVSLVSSGGGTFLFSNSVATVYLEIGSTAPINGSDLVLGSAVTTVNMVGDATFNLLIGSGLADTIQGGGAGDWLAGGAGADRFIYSVASDSTTAAPDSIFDFVHGVDKLDVSALHLGASDINWLSSGGSTYVFIDTNHDATNDMLIQLNGTPSVSIGDFLL